MEPAANCKVPRWPGAKVTFTKDATAAGPLLDFDGHRTDVLAHHFERAALPATENKLLAGLDEQVRMNGAGQDQ